MLSSGEEGQPLPVPVKWHKTSSEEHSWRKFSFISKDSCMSLVVEGRQMDTQISANFVSLSLTSHPVVFQLQKLSAPRPVDKGGFFPFSKQRMLSTFIGTHWRSRQHKQHSFGCAGASRGSSCAWLGYGWILAEQRPVVKSREWGTRAAAGC